MSGQLQNFTIDQFAGSAALIIGSIGALDPQTLRGKLGPPLRDPGSPGRAMWAPVQPSGPVQSEGVHGTTKTSKKCQKCQSVFYEQSVQKCQNARHVMHNDSSKSNGYIAVYRPFTD